MLKYLEIKNGNHNATHLKVYTYYSLGGYSYWTGENNARGYYLAVQPVERSTRDGVRMEGFVAFSGIKKCILPVSRKSKKAEEKADQIAPDFEKDLIDYVCRKNGLVLAEVENYV